MTEKTYEMLWDCKYCGAQKLLGLTHRHCPICGAPQDQTARYFPSEDEKVAVEDHEYAGADLNCPACGEANSARGKHCRHCGSPLEGGTAVGQRAEQVHAEGAFGGDSARTAQAEHRGGQAPPPQPSPAQRRSPLVWLAGAGCLTVLVGGIALIAVLVLWTREAALEVVAHRWERTIQIERFGEVKETGWCDELPTGAREISRRQAKRSTKKVADGEDCQVRKKDQGDGTFKEIRECKTRYKEEPVMSDECTYRIKKWKLARTARAQGSSLNDTPSWPKAALSRAGTCDGCERGGKRVEKYTVVLREESGGKSHDCALPESKWKAMAPGSKWRASVRKLTGSVDCSSLQIAK